MLIYWDLLLFLWLRVLFWYLFRPFKFLLRLESFYFFAWDVIFSLGTHACEPEEVSKGFTEYIKMVVLF